MQSDVVIQVNGLGKRYQLGAAAEPYRTLRESLVGAATAPLRGAARIGNRGDSTVRASSFWALRDVSFDVQRGEVLGIIGRNGAGKSTLLKLLSRITEPTEGEIRLKGRVASLLEVGTGFHPELSGRENIVLNGAILGMTRSEILAKFDEIVSFAEIEKFIDTPVKRYSSGMYLRLAFAVAAHLEPEILIIDEVLAVGDVEFQKKCLGKMNEVASGGRTVLFVSHSMAAVANLCTRAVFLEQGSVRAVGPVREIIDSYVFSPNGAGGRVDLVDVASSLGDGSIKPTAFWFANLSGEIMTDLLSGTAVTANIQYETPDARAVRRLTASISVLDGYGSHVMLHRTNFTDQDVLNAPPRGILSWHIPKLPLVGGQYSIIVYLEANGIPASLVENALTFTVEDGDYYGTGVKGLASHCRVLSDGSWSFRELDGTTPVDSPVTTDRVASRPT